MKGRKNQKKEGGKLAPTEGNWTEITFTNKKRRGG